MLTDNMWRVSLYIVFVYLYLSQLFCLCIYVFMYLCIYVIELPLPRKDSQSKTHAVNILLDRVKWYLSNFYTFHGFAVSSALKALCV